MSTYWYYQCDKCQEQSEDGINHGKEDLQMLLEAYPSIKLTQKILAKSFIDIEYNMFYVYSAMEFLDKHYEHSVYPISEHGNR